MTASNAPLLRVTYKRTLPFAARVLLVLEVLTTAKVPGGFSGIVLKDLPIPGGPKLAERTFDMVEVGVAKTPLAHRRDAPCQPGVQGGVRGEILVHGEYRQCLEDLEGFDRVWLLYIFDRNTGWRPKVKPPRGGPKRGLFATRGPHRPSPIGMTAAKLIEVKSDRLIVEDLDLLDGTPVIDIKPYLPFSDAHEHASAGWTETTAKTELRDLDD